MSEFNRNPHEYFTIAADTPLTFVWSGSTRVDLIHARSYRALRSAVKINGGIASLNALQAGEYFLIDVDRQEWLKLKVFGDEARLKDGMWTHPRGVTSHRPLPQMTLSAPHLDQDTLKITVSHPEEGARLHLIASPYALELTGDELIDRREPLTLKDTLISTPLTQYGTGHVLSEEMRYILKRQSAPPQFGNLASTPSLLVNRFDTGEAKSIDRPMSEGIRFSGMPSKNAYGSGLSMEVGASGHGRGFGGVDHGFMDINTSIRSWDFLRRGALMRWSIPVGKGEGWTQSGSSFTRDVPAGELRSARYLHVIVEGKDQILYRAQRLGIKPNDSVTTSSWTARADLRRVSELGRFDVLGFDAELARVDVPPLDLRLISGATHERRGVT